jgi:hypothetical protein
MSSLTPPPPPRGGGPHPLPEPPDRRDTLRVVLKVLGLGAGLFALLLLVGIGLVALTCSGVLR